MNARAEMPNWTLMVWMLDAYAEKCTGQQRRDEAIEQAAALRCWLAAQPLAPEGGGVTYGPKCCGNPENCEQKYTADCLPREAPPAPAREAVSEAGTPLSGEAFKQHARYSNPDWDAVDAAFTRWGNSAYNRICKGGQYGEASGYLIRDVLASFRAALTAAIGGAG